jgi:hypothetical protein
VNIAGHVGCVGHYAITLHSSLRSHDRRPSHRQVVMTSKTTNIAVYTFEVWDHQKGATIVATRMGTAEAIRRVKGMADLESKRLVDESTVDADGFYPAPPANKPVPPP